MQFDKDKCEIGLLYGLISKVRAMLMLKEMLREGWIKADGELSAISRRNWSACRPQSCRRTRRYNPLALNPYVLFKALPQVRNYSEHGTGARDGFAAARQPAAGIQRPGRTLVLQQTLVQIVGTPTARPAPSRGSVMPAMNVQLLTR